MSEIVGRYNRLSEENENLKDEICRSTQLILKLGEEISELLTVSLTDDSTEILKFKINEIQERTKYLKGYCE